MLLWLCTLRLASPARCGTVELMETQTITRSLNVVVRQDLAHDDCIPVHWRLDQADRQGVVRVMVPDAFGVDRPVIAELCALNFLMSPPRPVFGGPRAPASATVSVSSGAIRKLMRKESCREALVPFGRFLFVAFSECDLKVDQAKSWTDTLPVSQEYRIEAAATNWERCDVQALKTVVGVSRHAIERYIERVGAKNVSSALSSIKRLLASSDTTLLPVGDRRKQKRLAVHGKSATTLMHGPSKTVFVLVPDGDDMVLASVYRDEVIREKQPVMVGGRIEYRWR